MKVFLSALEASPEFKEIDKNLSYDMNNYIYLDFNF